MFHMDDVCSPVQIPKSTPKYHKMKWWKTKIFREDQNTHIDWTLAFPLSKIAFSKKKKKNEKKSFRKDFPGTKRKSAHSQPTHTLLIKLIHIHTVNRQIEFRKEKKTERDSIEEWTAAASTHTHTHTQWMNENKNPMKSRLYNF